MSNNQLSKDEERGVIGYAIGYNNGLIDGVAVGLENGGGGGDIPDTEWQPPEDWIEVPEPNANEIYFLIEITDLSATYGSYFGFDMDRYDGNWGDNTTGSVDWGDGTIINYRNGSNTISHTYSSTGQYLVKFTNTNELDTFQGFRISQSAVYSQDYSEHAQDLENSKVLICKMGTEIKLTTNTYADMYCFKDQYKVRYIKCHGVVGNNKDRRYFQDCHSLCKLEFDSELIEILPYEYFYNCWSLRKVSLPNCKHIEEEAFYNCKGLVEINAPNLETVSRYSFYNCYSLKKIDFPNFTGFANDRYGGTPCYAFYSCSSLKSVNLPNCPTLPEHTFWSCSTLQKIDLPLCTSVGIDGFYNCLNLREVDLPLCTSVGDYGFADCRNLQTATFDDGCTFGSQCFRNTPYLYPPRE